MVQDISKREKKMKVVVATQSGSGVQPFQNHDVREWSRIDSLTGALERARLETDQWTANTNNTSHKYGKVVDSRSLCAADGALQQQAKRQLEVFQSQIPGGRLQVIKTQTVSSSRWTNSTNSSSIINADDVGRDFENLQLSLNSLDFTSQKSKANVAKSAARRPPSRTRVSETTNATAEQNRQQQTTNIHRVSRLCRQIHENSLKQMTNHFHDNTKNNENKHDNMYEPEKLPTKYTNLVRTKSSSSEDITENGDIDDIKQLQDLKRTSKIRHSLQFSKRNKQLNTKPVDLPENIGSVRKICEDLETGRRLNTALRGNSVNINSIDQLLNSISNTRQTLSTPKQNDEEELESDQHSYSNKQKRNSFVTVESLQEVRGRLRRTSNIDKNDDADDGIVTENNASVENEIDDVQFKPQIRSYMYGMETNANHSKTTLGTGSLDSRSKLSTGSSLNRNDDWYNRRKSYGFEQVTNENEQSNGIWSKNKPVESSTDSGICKSTDVVSENDHISNEYAENVLKTGNVKKYSSFFEQNTKINERKSHSEIKTTTIKIPVVSDSSDSDTWQNIIDKTKRHSIAVDESKYVTKKDDFGSPRNSLVLNEKFPNITILNNGFAENGFLQSKKQQKKVEFCKTEIHFAAESGKVNIVETDEKPPPTNNFRRRRKNAGFINEDFNKSDLPMLHFGDSTYEKTLLGLNDLENITIDNNEKSICDDSQLNTKISCSTVTVNTNANNHMDVEDVEEEDRKENFGNEIPRGILKNKPIKPKPYHLGDTENILQDIDNDIHNDTAWDIKLRSNFKTETPLWKSTVTVSNTVYNNHNKLNSLDTEPTTEFQKLLKSLRPVSRNSVLQNDQNCLETQKNDIKSYFHTSTNESNLTVAERIKQAEEMHFTTGNKGFSTKINFGNGEATVVENNSNKLDKGKHMTWPRMENSSKDVVTCIGMDGLNFNLKTKDEQNTNTTTTTKIKIDLAPSPTNLNSQISAKVLRTPMHNFKSPMLILNTIKSETDYLDGNYSSKKRESPTNQIPQQLEALKKLYEDVQSESETDKDFESLYCNLKEKDLDLVENDNCSIVSGSWSRMKTFKSKQLNKVAKLPQNAHLEKDFTEIEDEAPNQFASSAVLHQAQTKDHKLSEITKQTREIRSSNITTTDKFLSRLKSEPHIEDLSSPGLVGQNVRSRMRYDEEHVSSKRKTEHTNAFVKQQKDNSTAAQKIFLTPTDKKFDPYKAIPKHGVVLRQPHKSEMAYFGINVSSDSRNSTETSTKKATVNKKNTKSEEKKTVLNTTNTHNDDYPIYENLKDIKGPEEFNDSILDELTKAADQILQAVNEYADKETSKCETQIQKTTLDTISETKSWKKEKHHLKSTSKSPTTNKLKLKHNASTSSNDSMVKECKRVLTSPSKKTSPAMKPTPEKTKKKTSTTESPAIKTTKVRRLQRASSREALLQSHGSSSEDLGVNNEQPIRKPRLIKRTKATQLTISNGFEICKKNIDSTTVHKTGVDGKTNDRVPVSKLPEIRHKTAVSTIRSVSEKSSKHEKTSRGKSDAAKKKTTQKKISSRGSNTTKSEREKEAVGVHAGSHHNSAVSNKK